MSAALKYYNYDKIMSFNAMYMMIVGARGLGKTYGAKEKVIRDAIRKGDQFIYLRRYKTEMIARNTFFADLDLDSGIFAEWDFRIFGSEAQMSPKADANAKKRTWRTIGFFIALSTAQTQKSVSFPRVKTIIFDEFIIEKGNLQYLPDEANAFNNFYNTVDRYKDKTKVFFLANSVSMMNPYFIEWRVDPDLEYATYADGFIAVHLADSKEFATGVYQTRFGRFIAGTEYADYAVGSEFADNNGNLVGAKPSDAKYQFTLETAHGIFSLWYQHRDVTYWVQEKRPKEELLYTTLPERMTEDKTFLMYGDRQMQNLRSCFKNGRMFFDGPKSRNALIDIFKR